ncbi:hypothetical protein SAMN05216386_0637 [Nitrosospira briensis]|uniref:Uncharacterized protein n=1 Tax=Nitrosospira briensis TaxID=35799 RepID=A0A1I4YDE3_9PROT|nr:hypothetical protein SAMN05216386_0637 [Nitrosospira briensis]
MGCAMLHPSYELPATNDGDATGPIGLGFLFIGNENEKSRLFPFHFEFESIPPNRTTTVKYTSFLVQLADEQSFHC